MKKYDVLVVGDVNVDLVVTGIKKMPLPGQERYVDDISLNVGGGAALSAIGLARLGMKSAVYGSIGDDFLGEGLQRGLVALRQPQLGHAARQMALRAVHLRQRRGQRSRVKPPLRPVGALPEVGAAAWGLVRKHAAIMRHIHRFMCGECCTHSPQVA